MATMFLVVESRLLHFVTPNKNCFFFAKNSIFKIAAKQEGLLNNVLTADSGNTPT